MNLTETPKQARYRHRLYVVLPLFLVLGWVGVRGDSRASILSPTTLTQSGTLTLVDNGRVAVEGGAVTVANGEISLEGSALITGKSGIALRVGKMSLLGWNGAFEVDASSANGLTVAALTTPVLVRQGGNVWLVPVEMQLTIKTASSPAPDKLTNWVTTRRPLPLPAHYLRERLPEADRLMTQVSARSLASKSTIIPPLLGNTLRFTIAREEALKIDGKSMLTALSDTLVSHDLVGFDALIRDVRTYPILDRAETTDLLTLLSLSFELKRDMQILPSVLRHADLTALLRFHPLLRDRVWLTDDAASEHDVLLLSQLLQPAADYEDAAVSAVTMQAWKISWVALRPDTPTLDVIASIIARDIVALDAAGYPARARGYAAGFVSGIQPEPADLSQEAHEALDRLRSIYDIILSVTAPVDILPMETSAEDTASSLFIEHSVIPENEVRATLSGVGCMFTTQTVLRMGETGVYTIDNVVIGTPAGDRQISFVFDPVTGLVSGIEKDGQILPYSLPLQKYVEWVRQ